MFWYFNAISLIFSRYYAICTGAFGYFEVTHDITNYCKATVFSQVGKKTPIAVRFSTVGGESGSGNKIESRRKIY